MNCYKAVFIGLFLLASSLNAATFKEFLQTLKQTGYLKDHIARYGITFDFMQQNGLTDFSGKKILELGSQSPILSYLKTQGADTQEYTAELRETVALDSNQFDIVLLLEVFEHVKDIDATSHTATYCYTGVHHLLKEISRLLKPNGVLVLTTPNANSLTVLARWLSKEPPYNYAPHPREYTKNEVLAVASAEGFKLQSSLITDCWGLPGKNTRSGLTAALKTLNANLDERGDDMLFMFTTPAS